MQGKRHSISVLRRKNKKNYTDLLRAERQHLKANCIIIHLSCEEAFLVTLQKQPCARAKTSAVLLGQENRGCLPSDPSIVRRHFISQLAEFSISFEKFWSPRQRNCSPGSASVSACSDSTFSRGKVHGPPQQLMVKLCSHRDLTLIS